MNARMFGLAVLLSGCRPPETWCSGQSPCAVVEQRVVGEVTVARLALHAETPSDGAPRDPCLPEVWVARGKGADGKPWTQRLLEICNDGYGGSGLGRDSVASVREGELQFSRTGGDMTRWTQKATVGLSPPRLLWQEAETGGGGGTGTEASASWDWPTHRGSTRWSPSACEGDEVPPDLGASGWGYAPIPVVQTLGADPFTCAVRVGTPLPTLSVILERDRTLHVRLQGGTEGALRLWLASPEAESGGCAKPPRVWTHKIGAVETPNPAGTEPVLVAEQLEDHGVTLTITLPEPLTASINLFPLVSQPGGQLSVAWLYSTGEVRESTSNVEAADAGVLGAVLPLACDPATGGPLPPASPDEPLISF